MKLDEFVPVSNPEELGHDLRLIVRFYFEDSDRVVTFYATIFNIYDENEKIMRMLDRAFKELLWPVGPR